MTATAAPVTVSPSDFAWLWDSCRACWWQKVHNKSQVRFDAMPAIFNQIDHAMKRFVTREHLREHGVPVSHIDERKEFVMSKPFEYAGVSIVVRGKLDRLCHLETGDHAIIDYKTTQPSVATIQKYWRQLHGYEFALRCPEHGEPIDVGALGLFCFDAFNGQFKAQGSECALIGKLVYLPVELDRSAFEDFMRELCEVVALPAPPPPSYGCAVCAALAEMMKATLEAQEDK